MDVSKQQIDKFRAADRGMGYSWTDFIGDANKVIKEAAQVLPPKPSGTPGTTVPPYVPATTLPPPASAPAESTTDKIQKYLFPAAIVGVGLLVLTSGKKSKSLSGMKIGIKDIGKKLLPELEHVALVSGGMIASQKFLDLNKLAEMLPENLSANKGVQFVIVHQGAVKALAGVVVAGLTKNPMIKCIAYGVAIGGLIKEVRTMTSDASGSSWVPQIGMRNSLNPGSANAVIAGNNNTNVLRDRAGSAVLAGTGTIGCGDYGSY